MAGLKQSNLPFSYFLYCYILEGAFNSPVFCNILYVRKVFTLQIHKVNMRKVLGFCEIFSYFISVFFAFTHLAETASHNKTEILACSCSTGCAASQTAASIPATELAKTHLHSDGAKASQTRSCFRGCWQLTSSPNFCQSSSACFGWQPEQQKGLRKLVKKMLDIE